MNPPLIKIIKNGFCFLVISIVTYYSILFVFVSVKAGGTPVIYRFSKGMVWKGGYTYERFNNFNKTKKYNVIIFGSSRANRGLNPHVFEQSGLSCYNLATDDQTPLNTCVLAHEYIHQNCDLVIIDLFDKVFSQDPLESSADIIQNVTDDRTALHMTCASDDIRTFNLFNVRLFLKNKNPDYKESGKLYNGFRSLDNNKSYFKIKTLPYKTNLRHLRAFAHTLAYLNQCRVPYILVSQPMLPMARNPDHVKFLNDIQPILDQYGKVLYDFTNLDSLLPVQYYSDTEHLNVSGSEIYTRFIIDSLVKKSLLTFNN